MLHFRIAMDSYFLPKPVGEIIEKQEFSKVPLITGVTNDEFGFLLAVVSEHFIYYMTLLSSINSLIDTDCVTMLFPHSTLSVQIGLRV